MKNLLIASAIAAAAFATPAFAQEEAPARESFTGPWIAAVAGIDVLTAQENNDSATSRGVLFGGGVGYDFAAGGNAVVGIEGEVTKSGADEDIPQLLTATDNLHFEAGMDYYAGVRVGMRAGKGFLVYLKGGYVNSQIKSRYTATGLNISTDESSDGFRVGLGGEYSMGTAFIRAEMRYQDVGDFRVLGVATGLTRTHTQALLGVGARF